MTREQREVLAHVVVDPDEWWKNNLAFCVRTLGQVEGEKKAEANLIAKVARWSPDHEAKRRAPDFKTRKQRDDISERAHLARQGLPSQEIDRIMSLPVLRIRDRRAADSSTTK